MPECDTALRFKKDFEVSQSIDSTDTFPRSVAGETSTWKCSHGRI